MITKRFSQDLHDQYDEPARKAASEWMMRVHNLRAEPHPDKYWVDLVVYKNNKLSGYAEVEVRGWSPCPYETIHVPHRKDKFFDSELPTVFFALTKDLQNAYWIDAKYVVEHPVIEVKNKEVPHGEMFFDVPKKLFAYVSLRK